MTLLCLDPETSGVCKEINRIETANESLWVGIGKETKKGRKCMCLDCCDVADHVQFALSTNVIPNSNFVRSSPLPPNITGIVGDPAGPTTTLSQRLRLNGSSSTAFLRET